jgi:hypothetical protein
MNEITCVIYESRRLLTWSWRFKFVAANGERIGHQYNRLIDAINGARIIIDPHVPVRLIVQNRNGKQVDHGIIRAQP